ncbi:acylneuraminate cytidylyltransferase [Flavobacterium cheniae]|uniref:N-acylneuraminate cytidylyltransferase n=1 Tax=Flavobacterium cheniae TaxID=295428 RepID=A0A562KP26_9FLAO|nr:acylneuraminate cytidylyltransferase [Flavobacterium cheniae]TDR22952.1 N-acylneuraminate cytidylyltransferase [Flavobacterium cheniae]TWH97188.1 N-acylneuraminate cytidylyltransferase [Flavobacterium cheniae]
MKKVAIIPLRKGSKGIPGKNKKKMLGRPLFSWVLGAAIFSDLDEVYVFTDDEEILNFISKEYHWTSKVKGLLRNDENANDTASTESAMLEFAEKINHDFDVLCLLQATSPLTTSQDINSALSEISTEGKTAALSVVKTHRFTWNVDGTPQNYDVFNRPRRQDFAGLLMENGAVYATTKDAFLKSKNRVSETIGLVEMPEETLMEIDSLSDWTIIESLLAERQKAFKKQERINYLVLDVDGVFTDGCVYYGAEGELMKKFDMRDGMGLEILRQNNVEVVVITSENSDLVAKRMQKLQIKHTFLGVKDKYSFLQDFINQQQTSWANLAYVGDDVNDLANLCTVGWSFAPANATTIVKQQVDFTLSNNSADGAIREVCEWIMNYNKRF